MKKQGLICICAQGGFPSGEEWKDGFEKGGYKKIRKSFIS